MNEACSLREYRICATLMTGMSCNTVTDERERERESDSRCRGVQEETETRRIFDREKVLMTERSFGFAIDV